MKKFILTILLTIVGANGAYAEDVGGWVIVDSGGKVVSGVMVCTASVCGDPNSAVSKDLLKEGQTFVLQTKSDTNGNVAGIGANNPNTQVKVDVATNTFTVTTKTEVPVTPTAVIKQQTVQTFNPTVTDNGLNESKNTVTQTTSVEVKVNNSVTVTNEPDSPIFDWELFLADLFKDWLINFDALWSYFNAFTI